MAHSDNEYNDYQTMQCQGPPAQNQAHAASVNITTTATAIT